MKPTSIMNHSIIHPPSAIRHPQSGQGLLIAVMIMLLVALLGAAFVGVVSFNLAQSARHEDVVKADQMAKAGIEYANEELTNSVDAADWRPQDSLGYGTDTATATTRSNTEGYYDEIEMARGWGVHGWYIKYPDPLDPDPTATNNPDFGGGRFLLRVEYPGGNSGSATEGFIRITSIGRSSNNPAVFRERVAYKPITLNSYAFLADENTVLGNFVVQQVDNPPSGSGETIVFTDRYPMVNDSANYPVTVRSRYATGTITYADTQVTATDSFSIGPQPPGPTTFTFGTDIAIGASADASWTNAMNVVNTALTGIVTASINTTANTVTLRADQQDAAGEQILTQEVTDANSVFTVHQANLTRQPIPANTYTVDYDTGTLIFANPLAIAIEVEYYYATIPLYDGPMRINQDLTWQGPTANTTEAIKSVVELDRTRNDKVLVAGRIAHYDPRNSTPPPAPPIWAYTTYGGDNPLQVRVNPSASTAFPSNNGIFNDMYVYRDGLGNHGGHGFVNPEPLPELNIRRDDDVIDIDNRYYVLTYNGTGNRDGNGYYIPNDDLRRIGQAPNDIPLTRQYSTTITTRRGAATAANRNTDTVPNDGYTAVTATVVNEVQDVNVAAPGTAAYTVTVNNITVRPAGSATSFADNPFVFNTGDHILLSYPGTDNDYNTLKHNRYAFKMITAVDYSATAVPYDTGDQVTLTFTPRYNRTDDEPIPAGSLVEIVTPATITQREWFTHGVQNWGRDPATEPIDDFGEPQYPYQPPGTIVRLNSAGQIFVDRYAWDNNGTPGDLTDDHYIPGAAAASPYPQARIAANSNVLFVEGNIRLQAPAGDAGCIIPDLHHLTIVSGGIIYVEAPIITQGNGTLALLAEESVVLNLPSLQSPLGPWRANISSGELELSEVAGVANWQDFTVDAPVESDTLDGRPPFHWRVGAHDKLEGRFNLGAVPRAMSINLTHRGTNANSPTLIEALFQGPAPAMLTYAYLPFLRGYAPNQLSYETRSWNIDPLTDYGVTTTGDANILIRQNNRSGSAYWIKDIRIDVPVSMDALILGAKEGWAIIPDYTGSLVPVFVNGAVNTKKDLGFYYQGTPAEGHQRWEARPNINYAYDVRLREHGGTERTEYGSNAGRLNLPHLPLSKSLMYVR